MAGATLWSSAVVDSEVCKSIIVPDQLAQLPQ